MTAFNSFIRVVKRECLRILTSKVLIFTTIIGPILALLLVQWLFSAGVVRDLPLVVVDADQTPLSRRIIRMADATPIANVDYKVPDMKQAQAIMNKGKADAILVIPEHTERNIFKGTNANVALYINNTNLVKGGALKSGLYQSLATVSYGIKFQSYLRKGQTDYTAMQSVQPVRMSSHLLFNPFGNYSYFLALGLLPVMLTVFIFLGSVYALGMELKTGTAKQLLETANQRTGAAIGGKMFPYFVLFVVQAMVMNIILFKYQGTPLKGSIAIIVISEMLLILAYQMLSVLFLYLTTNLRLSLSLGSAFSMMALTFSGLTFPSMAMPTIAKIFSWVFPYTPWLNVFMGQSLRGTPMLESIFPLLLLLLFFLLGVLTFPGMKLRLSDPAYWGKE
ncbi:MAG: ABC transporter permease [Bacteroidales bacterium]|nr:ABC transporter permease [Bacteroidales bacterium]